MLSVWPVVKPQDPLNTVHSGSGVPGVIFEMSPIVQLNSFWAAMSQQDLFFKAPEWCSRWWHEHRVHLQPCSGCLHCCKHVVIALAGFCECDVIILPGLPTFIFRTLSPIHRGFALLACLTAVNVSQAWITWQAVAVVKSIPQSQACLYVISLP